MENIDLKTFESYLDKVVDQVADESINLIQERPRYIHAVMVIAEDDEDGQTIQASRIKMIDPIFVAAESSDDDSQYVRSDVNSSPKAVHVEKPDSYIDKDIEKAIRQLEESRDSLNEN